jgi:hypothetical protein
MPGHVVVEDVADVLDVEAAGGDVGGDEDVDLAGLEAVELADPLGLLHVAVDLAGVEAGALEALGELAHRRLAVAEDDRGAHVIAASGRSARRASCGANRP